MEFDYLIVGAGLFGATIAYEASQRGLKCLVIDKRNHIGGNLFCDEIEGIPIHVYGAHIFHTSDREVWDFINQFSGFNHFVCSPIANYKGEIYNLPFNMNTFNKLWGVITPKEAMDKITAEANEANISSPSNLEEQAIALVGKTIYEKLIKGYTQKQWGCPPVQLPASIIKRLPVRYTYDNNYFNDNFQGIPIEGYNRIIKKMLERVKIKLSTDFNKERNALMHISKRIIYTGMIDEFYNYRFEKLDYRSLRFETKIIETDNFQGNAVINYTDAATPFTRVIEHKHFIYGSQPKTVVTWEYPDAYSCGREPFYPVNDSRNKEIYAKYKELSNHEDRVFFGGRLGDYAYYDMHDVIRKALDLFRALENIS